MMSSYEVAGMHCESCVAKIKSALERLPGVVSARVSLSPPQAKVDTDHSISISDLNTAVRSVGAYSLSESTMPGKLDGQLAATEGGAERLYPLVLIVGYLVGTTVLIAAVSHDWSLHRLMSHFMGGFFLVFSFFKFLDLAGFAGAYRSYDLITQRAPSWGFIYPFVELALGLAYIAAWKPLFINTATMLLMIVGTAGVLKSLLNKKAIRCACLGTVLNLPMTKVTLIEDAGMALMAGAMLLTR